MAGACVPGASNNKSAQATPEHSLSRGMLIAIGRELNQVVIYDVIANRVVLTMTMIDR